MATFPSFNNSGVSRLRMFCVGAPEDGVGLETVGGLRAGDPGGAFVVVFHFLGAAIDVAAGGLHALVGGIRHDTLP